MTKWMRALLFAGITAALIWPAATNLAHGLKQAHSFSITADEAFHIEVVENLIQTSKYQQWAGPPFAPNLTTGPSLLVSAYLISKLTSLPSALSTRLMSWIYHLALLSAVMYLAWKKTRALTASIVAVGLFEIAWRGMVETQYFIFGALGDGAAITFLVLALIAWDKKRGFLAGFFSTAAVLAKPYLFFLPLILAWRGRRRPSVYLGLATPALAWMGWMVIVLGWSLALQYWRDYPQVMRSTNGAALPTDWSLSAWGSLVFLHLRKFWEFQKFRTFLITFLGIVLLKKNHWRSSWLGLAWTFCKVQLFWWLCFSPGSQARYLLPALVCGWLAFSMVIAEWLGDRIKQTKRDQILATFALVMIIFFQGRQVVESWAKDRQSAENCDLCKQTGAQAFWSAQSKLGPSPMVWSSSQSYGRDVDLILSAPYRVQLLDFSAELRPSQDWISVGLWPDPSTLTKLRARNCKHIYSFDASAFGFWKCAQ